MHALNAGHDFRTQGSRTVAKAKRGKVAAWIEERASFHLRPHTSRYGIDLTVDDNVRSVTVDLGRWSATLWFPR